MTSDDFDEIKIVFAKDLVEVLRDYRTLIVMILMPVIIYPALLVLPSAVAHHVKSDMKSKHYEICLLGDSSAAIEFFKESKTLTLTKILNDGDPDKLLASKVADIIVKFPKEFSKLIEISLTRAPESVGRSELNEADKSSEWQGRRRAAGAPAVETDSHGLETGAPSSATGASSAAEEIRSTNNKSSEAISKVMVFYDARRDQNLIALTEVKLALNQMRASIVQKRLDALGIKSPQKYDLSFSEIKTESKKSLASEAVRNLLPFMLFTMLTVSIIYPALDVITGERERNTLQLLLMSGTRRHNIMYGKCLVVFLIGACALIIGLSSIYAFIQLSGARADDILVMKFPLDALLMCMLISLPLVVTLSSLSILLASWCKTFQQGQGYFVPFLFVSMSASSVCSLPELQLSSGVAFIPVVNTALALKEVLAGHLDLFWLSVSSIVTTIFAIYVTYLASTILDSERLLYGVADSRERRRLSGNYGLEVLLLCFSTFLLMFYVGQTLQGWDIIVGSLFTQLLVILLPAILLLRHLNLPLAKTMSLTKPHLLSISGALLLTPLCILISMMVYNLQSQIVPAPEAFNTMFTRLIIDSDKPLWLSILCISIAPGVCEELLFRGAILGLVKPKLKPIVQCLLVGLLFGLFHLSVFRIGPTAVLGVILTALTVWSGSIFPSMLVHILNNSAAILMGKYHLEETFLSFWPASVILGLLGLALFIKGKAVKSDR